jgi:hypothetical protein
MADYTSAGFFQGFDQSATGGPAGTMLSMRFTSTANQVVRTVKLPFRSGGAGAPTGVISIAADDGSGNPGAVLGTAPSVAIPTGNGAMVGVLGNNVNLVAGNVYHVRMDASFADSTEKFRMITTTQKIQFDQRYSIGNNSNDAAMAGLYWEGDDPDPNVPAGWYEGKPAEHPKVWEPCFGLYSDEAGLVPVQGEGYENSAYERTYASNKKVQAQSFIVQNVPAAYVVGGQVAVSRVRFYNGYKKYQPGNAIFEIYDAANNKIARGKYTAAIEKGWLEAVVNHVNLTVGARYTVVASIAGTNAYNYCYGWQHMKVDQYAIDAEQSFQGTQSYSLWGNDVAGTLAAAADQGREVIFQMYVPEPATMCLLAIGGVSVLLRKRR